MADDEKIENSEETAEAVEETPAAVEEQVAAEEAPEAEVEVPDTSTTAEAADVAEEVPGTDSEAPAAAEATVPAKPARSRKHLPRSLRRTRPKPKREQPAKRKPITRTPKPEGERGQRQERRGVVVSDKGDKTIVVKVDVIKSHPRYKKVVRRSVKFHAHDEANTAAVGDTVRIIETRPLSKTKHWRLAEVVEKAK
jgi:small subunit ribosomal protein S17